MGIMDKLKKSRSERSVEVLVEEPKRTPRNIETKEIEILSKTRDEIIEMRDDLMARDLPDSGYDYIKSSSTLALSILENIFEYERASDKQEQAVLNCYKGIKKWYVNNQRAGKRQTVKSGRDQFRELLGDL